MSYPTKVRVTIRNPEEWTNDGPRTAWVAENNGKTVEGRMAGYDLFRPKDAPVVLYEDEYEVVESVESLEGVWVRMSPQDNGTVFYLRCTEDGDDEQIEPSEAFYLLWEGCYVYIALNDPDPADIHSHWEGSCKLHKI